MSGNNHQEMELQVRREEKTFINFVKTKCSYYIVYYYMAR